ncbi:divisome protein SepX/GlpR [Actinacidiphila alni]|uniref:divisome protein SepX/GlpR n=1 Tax=Actinacidiphila alni TaxID=380248 RepID=UPI0034513B02
MSSSGLIYAVIVGAWAAYLVPMWLRRQDELNEARPTERFSTAIRLLSGRAAMERRVAKARGESVEPAEDEADDASEDDLAASVDVRGLAVPATEVRPGVLQQGAHTGPGARGAQHPAHSGHGAPGTRSGVPNPRAKVLARRRRTTTLLFLAFTVGAIAAAVGGLALLWAPAIPAVLLTIYIGQMRRQERRRFEVRIDQQHAAEAARRLRARPAPAAEEPQPAPAQRSAPAPSSRTADRRALVEQTDHAEWVDQQRAQQSDDDGWEPVPVPLPTYVTAPVAPRTPGGIDPGAPDTWSSARSGTAAPEAAPAAPERPAAPAAPQPQSRRPRPRTPRTPLFDQYADPSERPRAANE